MEALLAAASAGDLESLENAVAGLDDEAKRAAAAARDFEKRTALHLAAAEGHTGVCAYLVQTLGAYVNPGTSMVKLHSTDLSKMVMLEQPIGCLPMEQTRVLNLCLESQPFTRPQLGEI
uniref:Uncharacterized protein n=1 Tax=Triticum urartu TaxID=4572 RepID=A0A8R7U222_TRIUA